ncbi:hypothetical protein [Trujillonella endophytica]|uniref:hypothetical protein n=1 Tax=Trujillonella endophytica TaxID=673521 RepID=UPI001113B17D|nr:hypothetical protein [Trujillella endophytica]
MTLATAPKKRLLAAETPWRQRIPARLLPLLIDLRVRLAQRNAVVRETARLNMRFQLEKTRPGADVGAAATEYLRQMFWRAERRWRPELITNLPVEGADRVLAARDRDPSRGMVLTFMHHGVYDGQWASIDKAGIHAHVLGAAFVLSDDAPEYMKQHVRVCEMGATAIHGDKGYRGITEALGEGKIVGIALDVPGSTPVEFVGRNVLGSFGAARAAFETNSPVIVLTAHKDPRAAARIRLGEPIEPHDFPDAKALLAELLRRHEEAILEWPESQDRPMQRWGRNDDEDRANFGEFSDFRPL